jgi:hypothetical protein
MGVFGILRGLAGSSYRLVLASTIGIAIAQPFLLNAWTTVPAKWFSIEERATAVGMVTLASLVGTGIGMVCRRCWWKAVCRLRNCSCSLAASRR